MNITISTLQASLIVLFLFAIALSVVIYKQHRRIFKLEAFRDGLIAHARRPQVPTSQDLIDAWKKLYEELPEGSPKWTAYRNRLIEVGVLDADGNPKQAE